MLPSLEYGVLAALFGFRIIGKEQDDAPLLLFPIFREALDIDVSSIKIIMLQLKVAGRRGD